MTHVFALAHQLGHPGALARVEHGVAALLGLLQDQDAGGWWPAVGPRGPVATDKNAYDHAFVLLAAASALTVGAAGAAELFERASEVFDEHFWDDGAGKVVESWDRSWSTLSSYRGANSNMHATEALLAAGAATGDPRFAERAARLLGWFVDLASRHDWRLPEHFDDAWVAQLDFNRDKPADPFLPFGSTVGHGLEWARLALHVRATGVLSGPEDDALLVASRQLFARATADGWAVDGAPGFVYTVDWQGLPVVRSRMHWVVAEGIATAATLEQETGEAGFREWQQRLWGFVDRYLRDEQGGSWWHELDSSNVPASGTWEGKPDEYHAIQALLLPGRPVTAGVLAAL